jgi:hypothetical protein
MSLRGSIAAAKIHSVSGLRGGMFRPVTREHPSDAASAYHEHQQQQRPANSRRSRRRDAGRAGRRRATACGRPSDVRRSRAACGICRGSDISAGRTGTGRPAPARDRRKNTPCRKLWPWSQSRRGALPLCRWRGAPNRPPFRRKVCARDRATGQDRDHLRRRDCARRQPLPGNPG